MIAQQIEQGHARLDFERAFLTVDAERNGLKFHSIVGYAYRRPGNCRLKHAYESFSHDGADGAVSSTTRAATASRAFDAALFDVDGTLIDSNGAHADAWTQALGELGVTVELARVRSLIGMGADKLLPTIAQVDQASLAGQEIIRRKKAIFDQLLPGLIPTPGARALLEYLRDQGVVLVTATSADDRELQALLERAGIQNLFPKRTSKDDAEQSKPDPEIVRTALEKSQVRPERAVMIGDTPYDLEAAQRAGIAAVALRCGGFWRDADLAASLAIYDDPAALQSAWLKTPRAI
jgi:HAD superfamily hydrolase (TIGR01509 family)